MSSDEYRQAVQDSERLDDIAIELEADSRNPKLPRWFRWISRHLGENYFSASIREYERAIAILDKERGRNDDR